MAAILVGSAGSRVRLACVVPNRVVSLRTAAAAGEWKRARAAHERLYPLVVAIDRDAPGGRATVRLNASLKLLGFLPCEVARPPQAPNELRCGSLVRSKLSEAR